MVFKNPAKLILASEIQKVESRRKINKKDSVFIGLIVWVLIESDIYYPKKASPLSRFAINIGNKAYFYKW